MGTWRSPSMGSLCCSWDGKGGMQVTTYLQLQMESGKDCNKE